MELTLKRETFTDKSTIGSLSIDGKFECFILEDTDRGLKSDMTLSDINAKKVHGATCIPYGRYRIVVTKSDRFSAMRGHDVYLPILLRVPGYEGIRIHTGNKPADTEGCLLPADHKHTDYVTESTPAFTRLNDKINGALKRGEEVVILITK